MAPKPVLSGMEAFKGQGGKEWLTVAWPSGGYVESLRHGKNEKCGGGGAG
jgi:hypothetical protein